MKRRPGWVIGIGLLVALIVAVLLQRGDGPSIPLDPGNAKPEGGRALAQVLEGEGVAVEVVRGEAGLADAGDLSDATVVVTSSDQLGRSTVTGLLDQADGARVVVVDPSPPVADLFRPHLGAGVTPLTDPVPATCTDPRVRGLDLEVPTGTLFEVAEGACFPFGGGALLAPAGERVTLFGGGDALSNGRIVDADNAAIALRLLGESPRLVWYLPQSGDLRAGDEVGLATLLPRWLVPALWLVAISLLVLIVWRARRLGPLVVEPLPVHVRASETTRSRGRLYRRSGERDHPAQILRTASLRRAADRLGLGPDAAPDAVITQAAAVSGMDAAQVAQLLLPGPPITDDRTLISLAADLDAFDDLMRKAPR